MEIVIKGDSSFIDTNTLELKLKGNASSDIKKGSYTEEGLSIIYHGKDITNTVKDIKYQVNNAVYNTVSELEKAINELSTGTEAKITYTVTYNKETKTITRTVKIIE